VAQSKALEFLQKGTMNIIFPGGEYATNLIIANVKTLSHDDSNSHSFSLDGHAYVWGGGHGPLALHWIRHCIIIIIIQFIYRKHSLSDACLRVRLKYTVDRVRGDG